MTTEPALTFEWLDESHADALYAGFSDLQVSRRYPAGLALRLARVKRYRGDKSVQQADTMDTVRKLAPSATVADLTS